MSHVTPPANLLNCLILFINFDYCDISVVDEGFQNGGKGGGSIHSSGK